MALIATRKRSLLAPTCVLAPERYDPRRELDADAADAVPLAEIVRTVRKTIQPSDHVGPHLVLDTSDAREGIVISRKTPFMAIGSTKKVLEPGDVMISRLRPYLRQVAYVDDAIPHSEGSTIACSTEFYVLRSRDETSIAFLVPFLLARQVQEVLAASQEGGHHPRFAEETLLALPVPMAVVSRRTEASEAVMRSVREFRVSEAGINELVAEAEAALSK